ncbi:MAG: hypothetical protein V4640_00085 [Verrucomicrobiota bacterium]
MNSSVPRVPENVMPHLPTVLVSAVPSYSSSNRRASPGNGQRAYPWLLAASTGLAAAFCLMYLTKPVIQAPSAAAAESSSREKVASSVSTETAPAKASFLPDKNQLPGETTSPATASPLAIAPPASPFEQTNIRVQHILTAETPGGQLAKIDIDVPVLYQSRALRWTPAEVADARALLARLADYQEKSRALRGEGAELLGAWNHLVERSIPSAQLRADSPTLPANQQDAADTPRPAVLDTAGSIQIKTAGK